MHVWFYIYIFKFSFIDILLLMISMLHWAIFLAKKTIEPRQSYHLPFFNAIPFIQYVFGGKGCGIGSDGILPPELFPGASDEVLEAQGLFQGLVEWTRLAETRVRKLIVEHLASVKSGWLGKGRLLGCFCWGGRMWKACQWWRWWDIFMMFYCFYLIAGV